MSLATLCNHCTLKMLLRYAKVHGKVATMIDSPQPTSPLGVDVLVHSEGETPDRDNHWTAWLACIPTECRC